MEKRWKKIVKDEQILYLEELSDALGAKAESRPRGAVRVQIWIRCTVFSPPAPRGVPKRSAGGTPICSLTLSMKVYRDVWIFRGLAVFGCQAPFDLLPMFQVKDIYTAMKTGATLERSRNSIFFSDEAFGFPGRETSRRVWAFLHSASSQR